MGWVCVGGLDVPDTNRGPDWNDALKATEMDALEDDACEDDMDTGEEYSYLDRLLTDQQRELDSHRGARCR